MAAGIWVNIGSDNGLLPDDTKPLHEPMLTYHQQGRMTFILGQVHKRYLSHQSLKLFGKLNTQNIIHIFPGTNELTWIFHFAACLDNNYNMTVWILARNDINFSMAAGLIRLHMPGVKQSRV